MRSPWSALAFGVVVALGVVLGADIVSLSAQASDPRIGAWKLNVAKSKFSPGPAPRSNTMKVERSGQGEKVTTEGVNAEGGPTATQYTANFDGKDSPITGTQNVDTVSLKRIDARTTERTNKKDRTRVGRSHTLGAHSCRATVMTFASVGIFASGLFRSDMRAKVWSASFLPSTESLG